MYGPYPFYPPQYPMQPPPGGSSTDFEKAWKLVNKILEKEATKKAKKEEEEKKKKSSKPEYPKISLPYVMIMVVGLSPLIGPLYVIAVKHLIELAGWK